MPLQMLKTNPNEKPKAPSHIIGIAAGKGGVGKSSITVNLALALQKMGNRVAILDADIYGPSMRHMLPEEVPPTQIGQNFIPATCKHGIKMISMAYFKKQNESAAVRAPIANGVINQFIHNVTWGPLDYLLIDFPPGTGDIQLTLCQQANLTGAIMVTTPQEVALLDVRKAIHLFEQVKVPILGIIENMSYFVLPDQSKAYPFGKGGGRVLADEKQVPFLGEIPLDPLICKMGDEGRSIFDLKQEGDLATAPFLHIATKLNEEAGPQVGLGNFELKWQEFTT